MAGASVPVASAIATGNASTTATSAGFAECPGGACPCVTCGAVKPSASVATAATMNRQVMTAKIRRPPCPNQVSAATATTKASATGIRAGASAGAYAIRALPAAAIEIAIVSAKSTTSAPIGRNDHASPKARPAASGEPPPSGKARTSCQ